MTALKHAFAKAGYSGADALRYMFKKFLRDLRTEWMRARMIAPEMATV